MYVPGIIRQYISTFMLSMSILKNELMFAAMSASEHDPYAVRASVPGICFSSYFRNKKGSGQKQVCLVRLGPETRT